MCSYIVYIIVATAPLMLQDGPHSVRLQWDPPTPLGSTTGYKISYTGGSDGSGYVSAAQVTNTYRITYLENVEEYNITISGTSQHFDSGTTYYINSISAE